MMTRSLILIDQKPAQINSERSESQQIMRILASECLQGSPSWVRVRVGKLKNNSCTSVDLALAHRILLRGLIRQMLA